MKYFDQKELEVALVYDDLIPKLEHSFKHEYYVPPRMHHSYQSGEGAHESTLLLMPAWKNEAYVGLKVISVSPYNASKNMATIQGIYILMDAKTGKVIAQLDAKTLTNLRTAAASALASKYLSRPDASSLLMIGTGALAPEMIKAHCTVRPINTVFVWGRNYEKACLVAKGIAIDNVKIVPVRTIDEHISKVDIVSTATSSPDPLVFGEMLVAGQHVDLVGAFKPEWREADDRAILDASVFVDTRQGALLEAGELLIPMGKGLFNEHDIKADLFDLCNQQHPGRNYREEKTCFISVGYALEDLAAAELVWEKYIQ